MFCSVEQKVNIIFNFQLNSEGSEDELFVYVFYSNKGPLSIKKIENLKIYQQLDITRCCMVQACSAGTILISIFNSVIVNSREMNIIINLINYVNHGMPIILLQILQQKL